MTNLQEFFGEEDVFFAYGSERLSQVDFELDFEGKLRVHILLASFLPILVDL